MVIPWEDCMVSDFSASKGEFRSHETVRFLGCDPRTEWGATSTDGMVFLPGFTQTPCVPQNLVRDIDRFPNIREL
jgi:hypothetical protein